MILSIFNTILFLANIFALFNPIQSHSETTIEHVTIVRFIGESFYFIFFKSNLKPFKKFFRHGARSPIKSYPNNPTKDTYWNKYGGFNQITSNGLKQCFELGSYVKEYYKEYLNPVYDLNKLYASSPDYG